MDFQVLWNRIIQYQGEKFFQIRGGEFSYIVDREHVIPSRTRVRIPKAYFEEATMLLPLTNTVPIQHLRGPSYIYAILMDKRILSD